MATERSPGFKLLFAGIIGIVLIVPLMMIYALVWDRQSQSQTAQNQATNQQALLEQTRKMGDAISGVNLDEELTAMIKYQKGYNGCARMLTAMDEMLDKLINSTGIVGR